MGGRGASSGSLGKNGGVVAVKFHDGSIFHVRDLTVDNMHEVKMNRPIGHMRREYGSDTWTWGGRETVANMKTYAKVYSVKAKAVNPRSYVSADRRRINQEMKASIKRVRAAGVRWDSYNTQSRDAANRGYASYKRGKKVVNANYRRSSVSNALREAMEDRKRAAADVAFDRKYTGRINAENMRRLRKYDRKIAALKRVISQS